MNFENQSKINLFHLSGAIAAGLFNGFLGERAAHWMKPSQPEFFTPILIAILSYLFGFLILKRKRLSEKVPAWVILALLGSVICFFSLNFLKIANAILRATQTDSAFSNLSSLLIGLIMGLFLWTLTFSFFALIIIGTLHFMGWFITRCRTNQWT